MTIGLTAARAHRLLWPSAVLAAIAVASACGGSDSDRVGTPVLSGTPIPTVLRPTATPPVCDVTDPVAVPDNFPDGFLLPEGFVASDVQFEPHLRIEGRVTQPGPVDNASIAVEGQIVDVLREDWTFTVNPRAEGPDYTLNHQTDGRRGRMHSFPILFCPNHSGLTYEFFWITPVAGAPSPAN